MLEIGIDATLLDDIVSGKKTIEARLGKPKFLKVTEGDIFRVRKDNWRDGEPVGSEATDITLKVTQILYFETFTEMFDALSYEAVVPSAGSVEDALEMCARYHTLEDELNYGVVAFMFETVSV